MLECEWRIPSVSKNVLLARAKIRICFSDGDTSNVISLQKMRKTAFMNGSTRSESTCTKTQIRKLS